jgi:hypothetical protein
MKYHLIGISYKNTYKNSYKNSVGERIEEISAIFVLTFLKITFRQKCHVLC